MEDRGNDPTSPAVPTTTQWRNAVMAAFALGGMTLATWGPRLPRLRIDLGVEDPAIGLVLAGVTVGSLIGLTAATPVLARLGARRAIRAMLWLVAVGLATVGLGADPAHSVAGTALGFVIVGFGIGALDVMINVEGAAVEHAAGRTLMPLLHAAWSTGAIAGAGIGACCAALEVSVAAQFMTQAVVIAAVAVIAARFLPVTHRAARAAPSPQRGARVGAAWRAGTNVRLLLIGLVMLGVELGEGTANSWLTLAVRDGHGLPDGVAAAFFVAFAVGETLARVIGGPLVDRVGRAWAVRATTAVGAVGLGVFVLAPSPGLLLLGTLLWAAGVSMGFPLGMSAAADSGPDPAARVSVVASIGYLANLAGPPLIGFLAETFGVLTALWAVAALLVTGCAASGALRPGRPPPTSRTRVTRRTGP